MSDSPIILPPGATQAVVLGARRYRCRAGHEFLSHGVEQQRRMAERAGQRFVLACPVCYQQWMEEQFGGVEEVADETGVSEDGVR